MDNCAATAANVPRAGTPGHSGALSEEALVHAVRMTKTEFHHMMPGTAPLKRARVMAKGLCPGSTLPVFASDIPNPRDEEKLRGKKKFIVSSFSCMFDHLMLLPPVLRSAYEILMKDKPTKLYIDVDVEHGLNPRATEETLRSGVESIITEVRSMAVDVLGMPEDTAANIGYTELNASTNVKFSVHLVFHFFLANNFQCGAFMRRLRNRMLRTHEKALGVGDSDKDHPFFINSREKDRRNRGKFIDTRAFFCDLAVYTKRRFFRLYGCSKANGGYRPLLTPPERKLIPEVVLSQKAPKELAMSRTTFFHCLLQNYPPSERVYECMEEDGSVPESTNNCDFLRDPAASATASAPSISSTPKTVATTIVSREALRAHWDTVFPYNEVWALVVSSAPEELYAPGASAAAAAVSRDWNREFMLSTTGRTPRRHQHASSPTSLREILMRSVPDTLHIGPFERKDNTKKVQPSLIFDVDIRDYAPWRSCCADRAISCAKCWVIARFAQRVIENFLAAFGLGRAFTFFSGSKGIHVWVVSRAASENVTTPEQRSALIDAFKHAKNNPESEFIQRALGSRELRTLWENFIIERMGRDKFDQLCSKHGVDSVILSCLWPELDEDVTRSTDHPIKAPYCIHPSTGRICVFLERDDINPYVDTFDVAENAASLGCLLAASM